MRLLIVIFAILFSLEPVRSQDSTEIYSCGTWDAVICNIEKVDTAFVVSGMSMMPDCSPSGIMFEWWTNQFGISGLSLGMIINFDKFKPIKGYWKYKSMYGKIIKNNAAIKPGENRK